MTIPTVPSMPAGHVATQSDLTALSACATFLLGKPVSYVVATGAQSLTAMTQTVQFATAIFDPDGMWNATYNTRLTVQTPGFYFGRFSTSLNSQNADGGLRVTTGSNNPLGSGVQFPCWGGTAGKVQSGSVNTLSGGGILPVYMYALDYCEVLIQPVGSVNTIGSDSWPTFSLEFASV